MPNRWGTDIHGSIQIIQKKDQNVHDKPINASTEEFFSFHKKSCEPTGHTVHVLLVILMLVMVPVSKAYADTTAPLQGDSGHQTIRDGGLVTDGRPPAAGYAERIPNLSIGAGPGMALLEDPDVVDPIPAHRFSFAPVVGIKIGYDITRYFGVELGYDQCLGFVSRGAWTYRELPFGNLKINIPFHEQAFSFILGASNARWSMGQGDSSTIRKVLYSSSGITTNDLSAYGLAIDFGVGYDTYVSSQWSCGAELLYRHFVSVVSGSINGGTPYSSPRPLDFNNIGLNLYAEYHFYLDMRP